MAGFDTPLYRQNIAQSAEQRLSNIEDILRLVLLTAGSSMPVTQIATAFEGSQIGTTNKYLELYRNNFLRLIAVKVVVDFDTVAPGIQQASLSLTTDLSNYGRIDKLVEGTKTTSDTIWLKPDQSLYINTADTAVTLNGSQYRVLMFDPLSFAGYLNSGI
jgi:hypothetical protein